MIPMSIVVRDVSVTDADGIIGILNPIIRARIDTAFDRPFRARFVFTTWLRRADGKGPPFPKDYTSLLEASSLTPQLT